MSGEGGERTRLMPEVAGSHPPLPPPNHYYGTFQGVANYYQPQPSPEPHSAIGMPPTPAPVLYSDGYHSVLGYALDYQGPPRQHRLPCCGLGIGWFLFILGFFLGAIPWYIGTLLLICVHLDYREKPGLIACSIAALIAVLAVTLGVTKATHSW